MALEGITITRTTPTQFGMDIAVTFTFNGGQTLNQVLAFDASLDAPSLQKQLKQYFREYRRQNRAANRVPADVKALEGQLIAIDPNDPDAT